MELRGLLFILIMMLFVPVLYIFSNDNIFFIIFASILFISSFKNILDFLFSEGEPSVDTKIEDNEDLYLEIEEALDMDGKTINNGFKVVLQLMVFVFHLYCFFSINSTYLRILVVMNGAFITWNIMDIYKDKYFENYDDERYQSVTKMKKFVYELIIIVLITFVTMNKYNGGNF